MHTNDSTNYQMLTNIILGAFYQEATQVTGR